MDVSHLYRIAQPKLAAVMPLAKALSLLAAFSAREPKLGNGDLAARTGLPRATVTRLVSTLVHQGYLHQTPIDRKYTLAPSVLALGYGAVAHGQLRCPVEERMKGFAERHQVQVSISARDRLELIVVDSRRAAGSQLQEGVPTGSRVGIAGSPMGWALLAALPRCERDYLTDSIERNGPTEWQRVRRLANDAIARVQHDGYCTSLSWTTQALGVVAAPLLIGRDPPLVLACIGGGLRMTHARMERELAPSLLTLAGQIVQEASVS